MESEVAIDFRSMIAKPSIAFNDFAGTAKEVTARNVSGRNILSTRAKQSKIVTPSQADKRNNLSKVSRAYKQLSDSQMKAWGVLAGHLKGISTFGKPAEMTAHNAFVRINENRQMLGLPLLQTAPEYINDVPEVDYDDFWVTPDVIAFAGLNAPKDSSRLVVKMSGSQSVGVSSGWSKTVIVAPGVVDDGCESNITSLYMSTIGYKPELGEKVFIELWWLDADTGFVGETMRVSVICKNESQIEGEIYVPRTVLNEDNFTYDKSQTRYNKLSLEEVPGSALFIANMDFELLGYVAGAAGSMSSIPENFIDGRSFIPARGKGKNQWSIQMLEINIYIGSSYNTVNFSRREGAHSKQMEVFGVGLIR